MTDILLSALAITLTLAALLIFLAAAHGLGSMLHRVAKCLLSPETTQIECSEVTICDDLFTADDSS